MRLFNKAIVALLAILCCVAVAGAAMSDPSDEGASPGAGNDATTAITDTVTADTDSVSGDNPVQEFPDSILVTYKVVFGTDTVKTVARWTHNNTRPQLPDSLLLGDFATFSYAPDTIHSAASMQVVATINWSPDAPIQFSTPGGHQAYHSLHIGNNATDTYFSYAAGTEPNIACTTQQPDGDVGMWAFYGDPYHIVIKNKAAGDELRLASPSTSGNVSNEGETTYAVLTKDFATYPDTTWRFFPATADHRGNKLNIKGGFFLGNAQGHKLNLRNNGHGGPYHLAYWTKGYDRGSAFIPVRPSKRVTYNIELNGKVIKQVEASSAIDAAASLPASYQLQGMATFAYTPDTIRSSTSAVTAVMTWNPYAPLQFSATGEPKQYYTLCIRSGNATRYINYNDKQQPNITMDNAPRGGDSCQWAFVGNPYEVRLVNKAAGNAQWLSSPKSNTGAAAQKGGDMLALLTSDTVANPDYKWRIYAATRDMNGNAVSGGGIYLENEQGHKLNFRNPHLAYWTEGYDQGSAILISQPSHKADVAQPVLKDGVYRISTGAESKQWAAMSGNALKVEGTRPASSDSWHGLFLLRHTGAAGSNTYSIQDLETGRYLTQQGTAAAPVANGGSAFNFTLKLNSEIDTTTNGLWWNIYNNASAMADGNAVWNADASGNVLVWRVPTGQQPGSRDWQLERDSAFTVPMISARLTHFTGITAPKNGKVYRIVSAHYSGRAIYDNYINPGAEVTTTAENAANLYQLWRVDSVAPNRIKLQNLVTGKYMRQTGVSGFYVMRQQGDATQFRPEPRQIDAYTTCYFLKENNGGQEMHCSQSQGYNIVTWHSNADASRWYFKEATFDSTALKQEQDRYQLRTDMRDNASTYGQTLAKYFTDNACTNLKEQYKQMDTAQLQAQLNADSLPQVLKDMVVKIKTDAWAKYPSGTNWEQMFREHKYRPHTDCDNYRWSSQMGIGYLWGNQTGPSGISVEQGEQILYVFVDSVPQDSYVAVELIPMGSQAGQITQLKKGMNAVLTNGGVTNVNVRYWCRTDNDGKYDGKGKTLASFPSVMVHIEGGRVNGCFDLTRGMNDSTWIKMVQDDLIWAPGFNMRGYYTALHVRSQDIKFAKPVNGSKGSITTLMKTYDDVNRIENELEGFTTDSIGRKCFNGILEMNSVSSGYFASTYGCYISHDAVRSLLNHNYASPGEELWGPAHEWGHNHQQHILMCGSTEQSNNLFSNVVIYKLTNQTSRGAGSISTSQLAGYYNAGTKWYKFGTWPYTQMLWKMYLYYHVAENDTTFYPKVFRLMRDKWPLLGRWGKTTGDQEYLRFAVACSEAAGENLEDLFRVWGFFRYPINETVGDYRNTQMTTTKEMVDWALAEMRKYPKKGGNNIIFIDDHIKPLKNKVKDNVYYDQMRWRNTDDPNKFGQMGDFGSWDAFQPDSIGWTRATLTEVKANDNGSITYATQPDEHVVGYKVYNSKGELVWFANTRTFTVPENVVSSAGGKDSLYVTACATNGTEDYVGAVRLEVGTSGYASLYYGDRHLLVPAGTQAQYYGINDNGTLKETKAYSPGQVIPRASAMIIHAKPGIYRFEEVKELNVPAVAKAPVLDESNLLFGSDTTALTVAPSDGQVYRFYKLTPDSLVSGDDDTQSIGFCWGADGGTVFSNGAHQAYLALPAAAGVKPFMPLIDTSIVTGIDDVNTNGNANARRHTGTYNLSGQRVSSSYRGIVIQDGRKVLRK